MTSFAPVPGTNLIACSDGYLIGPRGRRKSRADHHGYEYVSVRNRATGTNRSVRVHQAVAFAFHGDRPPGMVVRHLDGDCANNQPHNLVYGTHQDNARDRKEHGRYAAGASHPDALLSADQVQEIRNAPPRRGVGAELARKFGVSECVVSRVRAGRTYRQ